MCGNVHAVYVTCSHVGNQNRMQKSLWDKLNGPDFDFTVGVPDQAILDRNWAILKRTLLRRQCYVATDSLIGDDNAKLQACKRLHSVWNGDCMIYPLYDISIV